MTDKPQYQPIDQDPPSFLTDVSSNLSVVKKCLLRREARLRSKSVESLEQSKNLSSIKDPLLIIEESSYMANFQSAVK